MNTSYSLLPILVLVAAAVITGLLVLLISKRKKSNLPATNSQISNPEDILEETMPASRTKSVFKLVLKYIGLNLLAGLLVASPLLFLTNNKNDAGITWAFAMLFIGPASLLVQLIIAIVWAAGRTKKEQGQALLLTVGLFLLVGLLTCSPMLFRGF